MPNILLVYMYNQIERRYFVKRAIVAVGTVGGMIILGVYVAARFIPDANPLDARLAARTQAREAERAALRRDQEQRERAREQIEAASRIAITDDQITWEPGFEIYAHGTLGAGYHATFGAWHLECIPSPVEPDAWDVRVYTDAPEFNEFQACVYMYGAAHDARQWCVEFLSCARIIVPNVDGPIAPGRLTRQPAGPDIPGSVVEERP